jgi:hypothetical protein
VNVSVLVVLGPIRIGRSDTGNVGKKLGGDMQQSGDQFVDLEAVAERKRALFDVGGIPHSGWILITKR